MTFFTGITGKCQLTAAAASGSNHSAIGAVREFVGGYRVRRATTDGIGHRGRRGGQLVEIIPNITFRYVLQNFDVLNNQLIRTAEGNLSKFHIHYYDGQEYGGFYDIAPNTVEIATRHGEEMTVNVQAIAGSSENGISTISNWQSDISNAPMTWRQTRDIKITPAGQSAINLSTRFRSWSLRVNNNAFADVTGNVVTPASVHWGKADYSGRIEIAKDIATLGAYVNTSLGEVVYYIDDRGTPTTKTYTFSDAVITQAEVRLPMDLVVQRIEWQSNRLAIT